MGNLCGGGGGHFQTVKKKSRYSKTSDPLPHHGRREDRSLWHSAKINASKSMDFGQSLTNKISTTFGAGGPWLTPATVLVWVVPPPLRREGPPPPALYQTLARGLSTQFSHVVVTRLLAILVWSTTSKMPFYPRIRNSSDNSLTDKPPFITPFSLRQKQKRNPKSDSITPGRFTFLAVFGCQPSPAWQPVDPHKGLPPPRGCYQNFPGRDQGRDKESQKLMSFVEQAGLDFFSQKKAIFFIFDSFKMFLTLGENFQLGCEKNLGGWRFTQGPLGQAHSKRHPPLLLRLGLDKQALLCHCQASCHCAQTFPSNPQNHLGPRGYWEHFPLSRGCWGHCPLSCAKVQTNGIIRPSFLERHLGEKQKKTQNPKNRKNAFFVIPNPFRKNLQKLPTPSHQPSTSECKTI